MPLDWSDYEQVHADRRNLCIHLLAVSAFDIALPVTLILIARAEFIPGVVSLLVTIGCMVLQGIGHSKETNQPESFNGSLDFLKRWSSEQYFKFPVFVLSERWWRQYQAAGS